MFNYDGNPERIAFLRESAIYAVHAVKRNAHVLIIGTGGGRDLLARARRVGPAVRHGHRAEPADAAHRAGAVSATIRDGRTRRPASTSSSARDAACSPDFPTRSTSSSSASSDTFAAGAAGGFCLRRELPLLPWRRSGSTSAISIRRGPQHVPLLRQRLSARGHAARAHDSRGLGGRKACPPARASWCCTRDRSRRCWPSGDRGRPMSSPRSIDSPPTTAWRSSTTRAATSRGHPEVERLRGVSARYRDSRALDHGAHHR